MSADVVPLLSPSPGLSTDALDLLAARAKALGDPVRLRIFAQIAAGPAGEACVCDVTVVAGRTQATVSHHLKILREAGLIIGQRRGTWVWYRVDPNALTALQGHLASLSRPAMPRMTAHACASESCCSSSATT